MNTDYTDEEISLAQEISETLEDRDALQLYLQFVRKYKEEHLRSVLQKVMSIERSKIRKTRGALFTYLMRDYGKRLHSGN
jgi:LPS O-antigen subunit length determinant protein (WzzB/FepE family)